MRSKPPSHTLIIGASSGIGRALLDELQGRGVRVSSLGRTRPEPFDGWHRPVSLPEVPWLGLFRAASKEVSIPIDGVVFVAGAASFGKAAAIPRTSAERLLAINFWAVTQAAMAAAELWREEGTRGHFISISSIAARRAIPYQSFYCASKAATARFLECLDLEHRRDGLCFASIYPGLTNTPFHSKTEWHGIPPLFNGEAGASPARLARRIALQLLRPSRASTVVGWRERAIDLADRVSPRLYNQLVLARRMPRNK